MAGGNDVPTSTGPIAGRIVSPANNNPRRKYMTNLFIGHDCAEPLFVNITCAT